MGTHYTLTDVERLELYLGKKAEEYKRKWKGNEHWSVDEPTKIKRVWKRHPWNWFWFLIWESWLVYRSMLTEAVFFGVFFVYHNILAVFADVLLENQVKRKLKKIKEKGLSREEEVFVLKELGKKSVFWQRVWLVLLGDVVFALIGIYIILK
ncbi:hypothetical protein GGR02_003504 [Anoxybacillus voinovskiensis]|uniref:Uncharacterized protein n=1 Tax=Anoxybacteroides voinovskiense TaxID=230470 RepID=A0A840DRN8_9BACL|nr:hypothetical protein [Anoxybacillus voinovskiensis]MBB4075650.1 hypothetical protein [Anoxybacillus voinovskiensis]GGJ81219.1 hypothetical protein GCM10008982_33340 [Anoxybacillus voinovskiensis]